MLTIRLHRTKRTESNREMNPEMKRALLIAIVIGLVTGGIVIGLDRTGILDRPPDAITRLVTSPGVVNKELSDLVNYLVVSLLAFAVAFMTLVTARRSKLALLIGLLLLEVAAAAWVLSLYHLLFPPLPSIMGILLGLLIPI